MAKSEKPEKTKPVPEIELGCWYKDAVSGWEGVATARLEYLNGCVRIELCFHDKDGCPKGFVFDQEQLVQTKPPAGWAAMFTPGESSGGPRDNTPPAR